MDSKRCLLSNRWSPRISWEESLKIWWLLHPQPVSIFTGCFQMQSQDSFSSSNERNSNETTWRKSVCVWQSFLPTPFSFICCGWQEIRQHMLSGKMPFLYQTSPWGYFLQFSESIYNNLLSVFHIRNWILPKSSTDEHSLHTAEDWEGTHYLSSSTHFKEK